MDRDFELIRESLYEKENLNTTMANEHVPDIEHKNSVI